MMHFLAQTAGSSPAGGAPGGLLAVVGMFWCCGITVMLGHLVIFIVALIQILSRQGMPSDAKILWCLVVWLLPLIGPILWWTIGSKQHPPRAPGPPVVPPHDPLR